jgi:hypothetical protein
VIRGAPTLFRLRDQFQALIVGLAAHGAEHWSNKGRGRNSDLVTSTSIVRSATAAQAHMYSQGPGEQEIDDFLSVQRRRFEDHLLEFDGHTVRITDVKGVDIRLDRDDR